MKKISKTKRDVKEDVLIKVCLGPGGIASGGEIVLKAFKEETEKRGIGASIEPNCTVHQVGCMGLCSKDVLVDILQNSKKTTYQFVKPEMVRRIVEEHIIKGKPVEEWIVREDYNAFFEKQMKVMLDACGKIDPEDIEAYILRGGYGAAKKVITAMTPVEVIEEVKASGLRGRGGAGFPTGRKWEFCRSQIDEKKYFICNADEGDPGAFMDRAIIEGNPHSVIEGMIIGAYAIGADEGYVFIRAEYPLAVKRLGIALENARKKNFLGQKIFGTDIGFDIKIKLGAGAFVCGEETALIASIEGKRGMPKTRPPFPAQKGLWGRPTVINNVETLANLPLVLKNGAKWYSSIGSDGSKGTKVFALSGKIKNTGLIEVPMGITLREIIYDIGGGIEKDRNLKAVQTGGPSGGCIPASMMDIEVDYESLTKTGSIMGSGGMIVLDETDCMVAIAKFFLEFTQKESCGKCPPCRIGTKRMLEILEKITAGNGKEEDLALLEDLCEKVKVTSLCGLGQSAPNPVLSTMKYFREEYEAHIRDKRCPAKVCNALITFSILEGPCNGCGACRIACPAGAITGEKKRLHKIDQDMCIKCSACFEVCRFSAVERS